MTLETLRSSFTIFSTNWIVSSLTPCFCTVYNGYSDNGYSDILNIVILLSLSIFSHLHIRHTKFIGYSDITVIVIIWP